MHLYAADMISREDAGSLIGTDMAHEPPLDLYAPITPSSISSTCWMSTFRRDRTREGRLPSARLISSSGWPASHRRIA